MLPVSVVHTVSCINLPGLSLSSLGALDKKQSAAK